MCLTVVVLRASILELIAAAFPFSCFVQICIPSIYHNSRRAVNAPFILTEWFKYGIIHTLKELELDLEVGHGGAME